MSLRLQVERQSLASQILELWSRLFVICPCADRAPSVDLHLANKGDWATPNHQPFSESRRLRVWNTDSGYCLQCGPASALHVDLTRNRVVGSLDRSFWDYPPADQREFFLLCFLMILRAHGRFGMHANGLVCNKQGFVIVGPSGCGKTTLSIALVSRGWRYVADDALVIQQGPHVVEALALRRGFSCTPDTASRFQELRSAVEEGLRLDDDKRLADLELAYPGSFVPQCTPNVILFPRLVAVPQSRLVALGPTKCLTTVMRQSPGILAYRKHATEQLKLLTLLVRQCRSYEILLGPDVYSAPEQLSRVLENAVSD